MNKLWVIHGPEIPDLFVLHPGPASEVQKKFTKGFTPARIEGLQYEIREITSLEQFINGLDKDLLVESENEFIIAYDGGF